jgi:phosphohistidine phosphatase SixA
MLSRRGALVAPLLMLTALLASEPVHADEAAAWRALAGNGVVLFRHAIAPGTGDPVGFRLDACETQRNLDAAGRAQASRIGATLRQRRIEVGRVLTSQWCRARDTAELAFPGRASADPDFNSFFADRASEASQTARARATLQAWRGPGALVVVTHQVNITGLTGIVPASGEGVVVRGGPGTRLQVIGRIRPGG